jgi:putative endonuclease
MGYVYMIANRSRMLYTGVTSGLHTRMYQYKNRMTPGLASRYSIDQLVFFEETAEMLDAIVLEKQVKEKTRAKKVALIESMNPNWEDLSEGWFT